MEQARCPMSNLQVVCGTCTRGGTLLGHFFQTGFPGGSDGKESACNAGDLGLIPGSGRPPGYPLQYSGLENSMDCIVHGVTMRWTPLSDFYFHFGVPELHWENIYREIELNRMQREKTKNKKQKQTDHVQKSLLAYNGFEEAERPIRRLM